MPATIHTHTHTHTHTHKKKIKSYSNYMINMPGDASFTIHYIATQRGEVTHLEHRIQKARVPVISNSFLGKDVLEGGGVLPEHGVEKAPEGSGQPLLDLFER